MELSLHIDTNSPVDIAQARAVLDFVERGIADAPKEPFVPVPVAPVQTTSASAPAPEKKPRKTRASTKNSVKAAVNGRAETSKDERQLPIPGTETKAADTTAPDFSTADGAARAVHAKRGKVGDVLDLLAPFKVTRVSELSKEQQPEFIAAAQAFVGVA